MAEGMEWQRAWSIGHGVLAKSIEHRVTPYMLIATIDSIL